MHILFLSGEYPPQTGGVGAYTAELARALVAQGAHCTVITSTVSGAPHINPASGAPLTTSENSNGVAVLPIIKRWSPAAMQQIASTARTLRADWLHVQYQTAAFAMNPAINLAPRFWRSRTYIAWTYHDLLPPYLFPKAGSALRRWITEYPATAAHAVIATNAADTARLAQLLGESTASTPDATRLHAIPIGSNVGGAILPAHERQTRRRRYGWDETHVVLGYFGALNRSKGGATLLRALQLLVDAGVNAHLLMIGDVLGASDPTNAAYAAEVRAEIARAGLDARIQWTGREDAAEISADLNAIDFALLPYADGASLRRGTLMAALANGCAIITTAPAAPINELRDGVELVYVASPDDAPHNTESVARACAQAVQQLIANPQQTAQLRHNAHHASRNFTWETIAARHLAIYRSIPAHPQVTK